ncbi:hypothetical protein CHARACLAT_032688 [Characodon lateralis]|uniref:Secreted protein n=1 Tax=Characodon lateralis TaxID=208331 RepID=A0ABU7DW59_9TELE|nr:hypothetical protein [Characodon lateralis]
MVPPWILLVVPVLPDLVLLLSYPFGLQACHHRVLGAQLPTCPPSNELLTFGKHRPSIQELTSPPGLLFLPATWTFRRRCPEFLIHVISLLNKNLNLHLSPESFCMWVKKLSKTMTLP